MGNPEGGNESSTENLTDFELHRLKALSDGNFVDFKGQKYYVRITFPASGLIWFSIHRLLQDGPSIASEIFCMYDVENKFFLPYISNPRPDLQTLREFFNSYKVFKFPPLPGTG